jgi:hypothetical protein
MEVVDIHKSELKGMEMDGRRMKWLGLGGDPSQTLTHNICSSAASSSSSSSARDFVGGDEWRRGGV